jgi:hypothetical protein
MEQLEGSVSEGTEQIRTPFGSISSDKPTLPSTPGLQTPNESESPESPTLPVAGGRQTLEGSVERKWTSFRDCKISFAVDTSGSTLGEVLRSEQKTIRDIYSILSVPAEGNARVLPWSSQADPVISVPGINSLNSYGGTDPSVLLYHEPSLIELKSSDLWFLITDGEIPQECLENFANGFSYHELHGIACVVIVVGTRRGLPSDCNISVGVSVFAVVPDCLFIYQDVNSGKLYVLQCKGRFTEILERARLQQPVLDDDVTWEDLPQISWKDLSCVSLIPPQKLKRDEIMLEPNLMVNLDDLFSDRLKGDSIIDRILQSREHVRTISLTAQSRGQGETLRTWAIRQELDPSDFSLVERPDVGGQARQSISTIFHTMQAASNMDGEDFAMAQVQLRAANSRNSKVFEAAQRGSSSSYHTRSSSIQEVVERSHSSIIHSRSISMSSIPVPEGPGLAPSVALFTRGFRRPTSPGSEFRGRCSFCGEKDAVLTLLLREPPSSHTTSGFPSVSSKSKLAFPLGMGNFPETDIICPFTCCDACSFTIVELTTAPNGDIIVCALPLVSYSDNQQIYNSQLEKAFQSRFEDNANALVFVAVLCTTASRKSTGNNPNGQQLLGALKWARRDLARSIKCPTTLSPSLAKEGSPKVLKPLCDILMQTSEEALRPYPSYYYQYPIEGFIVMTRIMDDIQHTKPQVRLTVKKTVFQRFLFHLTEQFHNHLAIEGPIITHLLMTQLTILDDPKGDGSPRPLAEKKTSFRTLAGLTRSIFGDRKSLTMKLSIGLDVVARTPLLDPTTIEIFRKLGPLFEWVETKSGHAMAIFLNYLFRYEMKDPKSAMERFTQLARIRTMAKVFLDPSEINARMAERLIEALPPLIQPEN